MAGSPLLSCSDEGTWDEAYAWAEPRASELGFDGGAKVL
jgi:hypothetical protein